MKEKQEMKEMKEGLIFDGDPGTDDAIALKLLSVSSRQPDWCVSTFGNMPWQYTILNLNILVRAFGMKCRIACGAKEPYDGHIVSCGDFHGEDALAGQAAFLKERFGISENVVEENGSLADLAGYILSQDKVTYIATGPVSTLAHLLDEHPEVESRISRLLVMGGGVDVFNKDGDKEYNFAGDGIAVKKVFDSGIDITMFPLDITMKDALLTADQIESMDYSRMPWLKLFLLSNHSSNLKYGGVDAAVLHDTLPILYYFEPDQFTIKDMNLTADDGGHIECSAEGRLVHVAVSCTENLLYERLRKAIE